MKERQSEPELARTDIDDRQQGQQPERDGLLSLCHLRHHAPSSGFVPVLPHARKDSVLEVGTRAAWTAEYATGAGTNEEHALSDRLASLRTALRLTPESTRWLGEYAAGYRGARAHLSEALARAKLSDYPDGTAGFRAPRSRPQTTT